jgi:RNA polymerase sigma-70 factor (ECF subfamily)
MQGVPAVEVRAQVDDRERVFALFVAEHRERAHRLAWRLLGGDTAAAEDVTQEAFVRAWRGLSRFRGDSSVGTWFYRILVRQAANQRRWRSLRRAWGGVAPDDPADPDPAAPGDPLLRRRIAAALERLSCPQREAFVLVHLEGWSVREAAAAMGKPVGTTKSHLHRALRSLRSQLSDLGEPPRGEPARAETGDTR